MSRFDRFRSLVRQVGESAQKQLDRGPVAAARQLLKEIADRKARVTDAMLGKAMAHAEGVHAVSVHCQGGRVQVDASFNDGTHLMIGIVPHGLRFAPRGAKEIVFRVEPIEAARNHRVGDLVASLAASVAHGTWAMGLQGADVDARGVIVDKEGDDLFRVDLRTVPAVRAMMAAGPVGAVVEALSISSIEADEGALSLQLELPRLA